MTASRWPSEAQEQEALFRWAAYERMTHPELSLLYHIPNGGARDARTGARLKAQGVRPGVPDICLPVPMGGFGALYIELKVRSGGRVEEVQREWIRCLRAAGNRAEICRGWDEARETILEYLRGATHENDNAGNG